MNRSFPFVLALGLFVSIGAVGCLDDIADDCSSDADCPDGHRCVKQGVKICLAPGGAGGDGSGGDGGSGGSGGDGGAGGATGGSGGEEEPSTIVVEVFVGGGLDDFLAAHPRTIETLVLSVRGSDDVPAETRFDVPIGASIPSQSLDVPGYRLEIPFEAAPGTEQSLEFEVQALAALAEAGGSARLASEGLTAQVISSSKPIPLRLILVSLDLAFDYDGDLSPDHLDCAPDDPAVHPGAEDICDGLDSSCNPGICHIPLPAGSQGVRDVACDSASCFVAAGGVDGGDGAVHRFTADLKSEASATLAIANPNGIATSDAAARIFVSDRDTNRIIVADSSRLTKNYDFDTASVQGGAIVVSPTGAFGFSGYATRTTLLFFANQIEASTPTVTCADSSLDCHRIGIADLDGPGSFPSGPSPHALAIRHINEDSNSQVYSLLTGSDRIAFADIRESDKMLNEAASGTILPLLDVEPRALSLNLLGTRLYVAGGTSSPSEAAVITTGSIVENHLVTSFPLPEGVCPSALQVVGDRLWVADDCQGSVWELPIGEDGVPDAETARQHPLPGCAKPAVLASLPKSEGVNEALVVGCSDAADRILVLGRD